MVKTVQQLWNLRSCCCPSLSLLTAVSVAAMVSFLATATLLRRASLCRVSWGVLRKVSNPEVLRLFFCERCMRCGFVWCSSYSSQWTGQVPGSCFLDKDADVPVLATSWGCRAHHGYGELMGLLFRAVYTGTRPRLAPAIRAAKGWRGRRELAPRCSATQLGARRHAPGQTRRVLNHVNHTPPPPPPPHPHTHTPTHTHPHTPTHTHTPTHSHTLPHSHSRTPHHTPHHTPTHTTPLHTPTHKQTPLLPKTCTTTRSVSAPRKAKSKEHESLEPQSTQRR